MTEARDAAEAEVKVEAAEEEAEGAEGVEERRAAERELLGIGAEAGLWKGMAECLEDETEEAEEGVVKEVEEAAEEDGEGVSTGSGLLDPRTALAYGIRRGSTCGKSTGFGPGIGFAAIIVIVVVVVRRKRKQKRRRKGEKQTGKRA